MPARGRCAVRWENNGAQSRITPQLERFIAAQASFFLGTADAEGQPSASPTFLIDYAERRRIKVRGEVRVADEPALIARLMPEGYAATPERAILFAVQAWEANCPRRIPRLVPSA